MSPSSSITSKFAMTSSLGGERDGTVSLYQSEVHLQSRKGFALLHLNGGNGIVLIVMSVKPYQLFSEHMKKRFGVRVHKISVDAGFGCPNRTGGRTGPGCLFCDPGGSGAVGIERQASVAEQIERGKEVMVRKYKASQFMAYFQPFSNTFAPVQTLRQLYDQALAVEDV